MSKKHRRMRARASQGYFATWAARRPTACNDMLVRVVEKPLLEVVMSHADHNQSRAAGMAGPEPQHAAQEAGRAQAAVSLCYINTLLALAGRAL